MLLSDFDMPKETRKTSKCYYMYRRGNLVTLPYNDSGSKRIVAAGCGRLGASVANALAELGYTIYILDLNISAFERLPSDKVREGQITPIVGDGTLESDLRKTHIQQAEVFLAVMGRDTQNALSAQTAKYVFQVPKVICRMHDPVRTEMYNQLGIMAISGTKLVTDMVLAEAMKA